MIYYAICVKTDIDLYSKKLTLSRFFQIEQNRWALSSKPHRKFYPLWFSEIVGPRELPKRIVPHEFKMHVFLLILFWGEKMEGKHGLTRFFFKFRFLHILFKYIIIYNKKTFRFFFFYIYSVFLEGTSSVYSNYSLLLPAKVV